MPDIILLNIGDSISCGMGVAPGATRNRYIDLMCNSLAQHQNVKMVDLSENGCTTISALEKVRDLVATDEFRRAVQNSKVLAYISLGNVDAKLIPDADRVICGIKPYRLLPARYQGAQLDPRPYFSERAGRRQLQMIESCLRSLLRLGLLKLLGAKPIVSSEQSTQNMRSLVALLADSARDIQITLIGTYPIRHWAFAGSNENFLRFDTTLKEIAAKSRKNIAFIDAQKTFAIDDDESSSCADRFHLNDKGHKHLYMQLERTITC